MAAEGWCAGLGLSIRTSVRLIGRVAVLHPMISTSVARKSCVIAAAGLFLFRSVAQADIDQLEPLRVSENGHYLAKPDGTPFFWLGDSAWDLFQRLDRAEVDHYLKDRADKGFTIIQAAIGGGGSHQGPNRDGDEPFLDRDPTRPNERYFAHVDWVVARARHYGLRMAIFPYWAGAFHMRSGEPSSPTHVVFEPGSARTYARWLGRRYRHGGVSWIFGGDANPLWPTAIRFQADAAGISRRAPERSDMRARDWRPLYDAMAEGLREGEGRPPFITYHPSCCTFPGMPKPLTSVLFAGRPWLTMNMIQSSHYERPPEEVHGEMVGFSFGWQGTMNYEPISYEFSSTPTKPVIDGEPRYEDLGKDNDATNVATKGYWTGYDARNAAYHAVFAGAAGHAYGNHAIWQFADPKRNRVDQPISPALTWREALQRPVSGQLRHLKALMLSRPYFTRVPDQSLIVGDAGTATAHIGSTRDALGRYAMIYLPHGQKVTIDLSRLAGPTVAWWFDPRNGVAERISGVFAASRSEVFVPPSSGKEDDWVLVLDAVATGFGVPGGEPCGGTPSC
jgi:hypothetical protein